MQAENYAWIGLFVHPAAPVELLQHVVDDWSPLTFRAPATLWSLPVSKFATGFAGRGGLRGSIVENCGARRACIGLCIESVHAASRFVENALSELLAVETEAIARVGSVRQPNEMGANVKVYSGIDELARAEGQSLGTTDWVTVGQAQIDTFAEATGDHQWIHVDPERAARGPFGATIAHGLLTLSLLPALMHELYTVENVAMAVNYGFDKVRFPSPVPVNSRVRASSTIVSVIEVPGGVQAKFRTTIEVEGSAKPACVAESIARFIA